MAMTAKRPKLAIDAGVELQEAIRMIAANEYKTIRAVVLLALVANYPHLKELVDKELDRGGILDKISKQ